MIAKQQLGFMKKAYWFGCRQLRCLRDYAQYWEFILTEGRRLGKLKDIHAGERCFIIGNGPSIRQQYLTKLKDEITFAVNWFVLHKQFLELNINYYCISSPKMWNDGKGFLEPLYTKLNAHENTVKFLEHTARPLCKRLDLFPGHEVYFVKLDYSKAVRDGFLSLDISKNTHEGNTVMIALCLPIAYYMGFKEVYLLGCDCDYQLGEADDWSRAYFYNASEHRSERDSNEWMLNYWQDYVFRSYEVIKAAFEADGRKIYNAGVGGKLEVFERVDFESILD